MIRLGYLHIPKTAGSSLNRAIFSSQQLVSCHITKINYPQNNTLTFKLACNTPYLAGHVSYKDLKKLNRNFIFSVFRDPRQRLISLYTYLIGRADNKLSLKQHPKLKEYKEISFYDYLEKDKPHNKMSDLLFSDMKNYSIRLARQRKNKVTVQFKEFIENGLKRFDVIYSCQIQKILDDLSRRGYIPKTEEVYINKSKNSIPFGYLGSKKEFLSRIYQYIWLDMIVYEMAKKIFPDTMNNELVSDDDFIKEVEKRFNLQFDEEEH